MRKVTYSNRANKDFLSIWAYIAEDSQNAADRLLDTIKEKCDLLGDNPDLGVRVAIGRKTGLSLGR